MCIANTFYIGPMIVLHKHIMFLSMNMRMISVFEIIYKYLKLNAIIHVF